MRDGNQLIDVSSTACGPSSTILIGATQRNFPYTSTVYQFDPIIFYHTNNKFILDDVDAKLFSLMKSPHAVDECKLVWHRVDKTVTCNRKKSWTFICSDGKVMRNINKSHFAPDSVGKIIITYQNAERKKSKGLIKSNFLCRTYFMLKWIHLFLPVCIWFHLFYELISYMNSHISVHMHLISFILWIH